MKIYVFHTSERNLNYILLLEKPIGNTNIIAPIINKVKFKILNTV